MIVAAMVEVVRVYVTVDGRVRFSQLGNYDVPIGNTLVKISQLRAMYRIEMKDIAEMLEMLQMASVQGTLGTTEFVPHDPLIPTWAEQKHVREEQKRVRVDECMRGAGVPPVPAIVVDYIQKKGTTKLSLLMLQPEIAYAVKATNFKLGQLAEEDGRFKVDGIRGSKTLSLAAAEA
jgi:hypothetical protein